MLHPDLPSFSNRQQFKVVNNNYCVVGLPTNLDYSLRVRFDETGRGQPRGREMHINSLFNISQTICSYAHTKLF